jgi:outer membrane protein assembly factor BamB
MTPFKRFSLLLISIAVFAIFLTACVGGTGAVTNWPGLRVNASGETAYVANGSHIYAINTSSGAENWRFPLQADNKISIFAAPALTPDGQLVVGSYTNQLYGLDLVTGQQKWVFTQAKGYFVATPLVTLQGIFAPSGDGFLYALDLSGNLKWKFETKRPLWATPISDGSIIYLPAMDHYIYALNAQTGVKVWSTEDLGGAIVGSPTLGKDGAMYIGTFGNELLALNRQNGKVLWRTTTSDWVWSGPLLDGDTLYFGDLSGTHYAVNASDGKVLWSKQLDQSVKQPIVDKPLLLGDNLYYVSEVGNFYAVDPTSGTPRWSAPKALEGKLYASPVTAGDQILVAIMQGKALVVALDKNGNQRWAFLPVAKVTPTPATK